MKWLLAAIGVGVAIMVAIEIPSIVRYIKIETM